MTVTANDSKSREKIYDAVFQGPDAATAIVEPTATMPDTTHKVPVYTSDGSLLGYVAVYADIT